MSGLNALKGNGTVTRVEEVITVAFIRSLIHAPLLRKRSLNGCVLSQRTGKRFGGHVDAARGKGLGGHG
jgi:hypothetical protein